MDVFCLLSSLLLDKEEEEEENLVMGERTRSSQEIFSALGTTPNGEVAIRVYLLIGSLGAQASSGNLNLSETLPLLTELRTALQNEQNDAQGRNDMERAAQINRALRELGAFVDGINIVKTIHRL